jgi:hypothetical protein
MGDILGPSPRGPKSRGIMLSSQVVALLDAREAPKMDDPGVAIERIHRGDKVIGVAMGGTDRLFPALQGCR